MHIYVYLCRIFPTRVCFTTATYTLTYAVEFSLAYTHTMTLSLPSAYGHDKHTYILCTINCIFFNSTL